MSHLLCVTTCLRRRFGTDDAKMRQGRKPPQWCASRRSLVRSFVAYGTMWRRKQAPASGTTRQAARNRLRGSARAQRLNGWRRHPFQIGDADSLIRTCGLLAWRRKEGLEGKPPPKPTVSPFGGGLGVCTPEGLDGNHDVQAERTGESAAPPTPRGGSREPWSGADSPVR